MYGTLIKRKEIKMEQPIITNPILKQLGKNVRFQKIVGYGRYAVVLDTGKKSRLGHDKQLYKVVTILTTQHEKDTKKYFSKIKENLKKQGVHVVLSGHFKKVAYSDTIRNTQVRDGIESGQYKFDEIRCEYIDRGDQRIVQYEEEWAPGVFLNAEEEQDWEQLCQIPTEHYEKLFEDAYQIVSSGLIIDTVSQNILYDDKSGFWFIDLECDTSVDKEKNIKSLIVDYLHVYPKKLRYTLAKIECFLLSYTNTKDKLDMIAKTKQQLAFCEKIMPIVYNLANKYQLSDLEFYARKMNDEISILQSCITYYDRLLDPNDEGAGFHQEELDTGE